METIRKRKAVLEVWLKTKHWQFFVYDQRIEKWEILLKTSHFIHKDIGAEENSYLSRAIQQVTRHQTSSGLWNPILHNNP